MDIKEIFNKWQLKDQNKQAIIDLWNGMAAKFGDDKPLSFENSKFLKLIQRENMLDKSYCVLDIGCGTGKYSIALAPFCHSITGIDLSNKMLEYACTNAKEAGITNASFSLEDWNSIDIEGHGWKNNFDLVFAHMTPAIQSAESFQNLNDSSKGWCLLSKPTRRTDPVSDTVKSLVGITQKMESADNDILYAFELLWRQGYCPKLEYENQIWDMKKTLEEAYSLYINRVKTYRNISIVEEEKIKSYLQSIAINGIVNEKVTTTVTTMYWHK